MNINKTIRIGTLNTCAGSVFCKIKYTDNKLSISGVEGPMSNGNARGSCGQIDMHLKPEHIKDFAPEWSASRMRVFLEYWDTWHLNDMQAGTPNQTKELEKHEFPGYPVSHYDWACDVLTKAGLHPDDGYKYGSKWLKVDVPADVLAFLSALPDTDQEPAWV